MAENAKQAKQSSGGGSGLNRAKMYQLVLFPFNNGATNVYYVLLMNYIAYYANGVLGLLVAFATTMVTVTRALDAVIDPFVGMFIDRTETKIGKFRPFMILGNVVMAVSALLVFYGTRLIPEDATAVKYVLYTVFYMCLMVGYSIQTSCTRSGQTCLTNDPKQRPTFTLFNTIASLVGMGVTMATASIVGGNVGYGTEAFFNFLIPLVIILSGVLTALPDTTTPYMDGMNWLTIALFCIIPIVAWLLTLWAMKGYTLTGERMKEIQAVNACRKDAISEGMSVDEALGTWQTIDQVPDMYRES